MRYQYGGFIFDDGEVSLDSVQRQSIYTPRGERYLVQTMHNCSGEIIPPCTVTTDQARQTWIQQRIQTIELALHKENQLAVGMLNNDGSPSANFLRARDSTSGIRMPQPVSFGKKDQADGVTGRTFSFTVMTEEVPLDFTNTYDFRETISWQGDTGPDFAPVELDFGAPDLQQLNTQTVQKITQRGQIIGIRTVPAAPAVAYPNLKRGARPVVERQEPIRRGNRNTLFPLSYQYTMLSDTNLFQ